MSKRKKGARQDAGRTEDNPGPWGGLIEQTRATRWRKGQSGNPDGPARKGPFSRLLDAWLLGDPAVLADAPPRLLALVQAACQSAETDGAILREVVLRLDGPVEKDAEQEMPTITVMVQRVEFAGARPELPEQVRDVTALPSTKGHRSRTPKLDVHISRKGNKMQEPEVAQLPAHEDEDSEVDE